MEAVEGDVDFRHLGVGDLDSLWIGVFIELALNGQTGPGGGGADQLDDHLMGDERFSSPILGNESEEAMFYAVPFAGSGRVVSDRNRHPRLIGEGLQFTFPQADPGTVTAAAIGGDQEP